MRIPIFFRFIFRKISTLFLIIYFMCMSGYFCLELLGFNSLPTIKELFFHFLSLTLSKSDFFLTFSFLLATIHTVQSLKQNGELTALEVNGISKALVTLPFFVITLFLAVFSYWNAEHGITIGHSWKIKSSHKLKKAAKLSPFIVKHLNSESRIIYQQDEAHIFDLYWILSHKEIWHCKETSQESGQLVGHFVDRLTQNPLGRYEKSESFLNYTLPFQISDEIEKLLPPEKTPLSKVFNLINNPSKIQSIDRAKFLTAFVYKIIHPWFPLLFMTSSLALIIPSRSKNSYFSFLIGIFCYLLFYSMMKTFMILGENYLISPWLTVFLIPIGIQGTFTYKLCKN